MREAIIIIGLAVFLGSFGGTALAETREFTDQKGRKIKAELVSHDGQGNLELRRTDGKTFTVKPTAFGVDDQAFIKKWIEKNPAKVDYRFDVEYEVEKLSGSRRNLGYKKVKNQELAYKIEMRNLARNSIGGLKFEYRVFTRNEADGSYSSSDAGGYYKGAGVIKGPIRYNETETITTLGVNIDSVDYDGPGYRYRDGLLGFMLRVKDGQGAVVFDYVSPTNTLKGRTWDTISKKLELKIESNN